MERKALTNMLEFVRTAVDDQPIIPIFASFVFDKGTVYGFNDNLAIICPCKIQNSFAVRSVTLFGFLKNSRAKEISFTLSNDDVIVKGGKSKITLPCNHENEFLFNEEDINDNWDTKLTITPKLIEGIKICLITSSYDYSLPALMGLKIIIDKNITLYSCDGDAITRFKIDKATKKITKGEYNLPNEFCIALIKLCEKEEIGGKLYINNEWVKAKFDNGYIMYGRVLVADDPINHEQLINETMNTSPIYIKIPKGLNNALLRARVVSDIESKRTLISIHNNKMRMLTETDIGNVRDIISLREDHPDIEISIHASLIQRSALLCEQMAILDNCTCYKSGDTLFQIITNTSD